jgi:hypothetical protein
LLVQQMKTKHVVWLAQIRVTAQKLSAELEYVLK